MIKSIKRFAALAVMVAVALYSGSLLAWNAKKTLTGITSASDKFTYLKSAIETANANDWLEIPKGCPSLTFTSRITVSKNIKLSYADTTDVFTIAGGDTTEFFYISSGVTLELEGLWLQHARGTSGSVFCYGGKLFLSRCEITSNTIDRETDATAGRAALTGMSGAYIAATNCYIAGNVSAAKTSSIIVRGSAVALNDTSRGLFHRCTFYNNKMQSKGTSALGGAIWAQNDSSKPSAPSVICEDCTFDQNENCVWLYGSYTSMVAANCTFVNNVTNGVYKSDAAISVNGYAKLYAIGNVFFGNMNSTGNQGSQQVAIGTGTIYHDWNVFSISKTSGSTEYYTTKVGPKKDTSGVSGTALFYEIDGTYKPTMKSYTTGGVRRHAYTMRPSYSINHYSYDHAMIWHSANWGRIGYGPENGTATNLWNTATTEGGGSAAMNVCSYVDIFNRSRKTSSATENLPGSWSPQKISFTVKGNGGRLAKAGTPDSETATSAYAPYSTLNCSSASSWTNVCWHCVGFTNSFTGASKTVNSSSALSEAGSTCGSPSISTLYCKWERNTYNVRFNANGGSGSMDNQVMTNGYTTALTSNAFTRDGYVFLGWAKSSSSATWDYTNGMKVTDLVMSTSNNQTINLYAVWMSKSAPQVTHYSQWFAAIDYSDPGATITASAGCGFSGNTKTINKNLTIKGTTNTVTISNSGKPLFTVNKGCTLTLEGVRVTSGTGNHQLGGAIRNYGKLYIKKCMFDNCKLNNTSSSEGDMGAYGGAIYNEAGARLEITDSVFAGNGCTTSYGEALGGAIYNNGGTTVVSRVTMRQNFVDGPDNSRGGAIYSKGSVPHVVLNHTTVTGNTNALYLVNGNVGFVNCSIIGNRCGKGNDGEAVNLYTQNAVVMVNTIVVGNDSTSSSLANWRCDSRQMWVNGSGSYSTWGCVLGSCAGGGWQNVHHYLDTVTNNIYRASNYFEHYGSNTEPPTPQTMKSKYGWVHTFYPVKDGYCKGGIIRYSSDWSTFGYKDSSRTANAQRFPTYSSAIADINKLSNIARTDQLSHNREDNPDENRRDCVGAIANYTTTFDYNKNGGTAGTTANSYGYTSPYGKFTPAANGFTRPGYAFDGWTKDTSSSSPRLMPGTAYPYSEAFDITDTLYFTPKHFYAQWKANNYTIKFDKNNSAATGTMSNMSMTYDTAKALTSNAFSWTGYSFKGWATSASGSVVYTNGQSVKNLTTTAGATVTLYAVWEPISYKIRYNANGGSGTMADTAMVYDTAQNLSPIAFTKSASFFYGWNTKSDGSGTRYNDLEEVENLTTTKDAVVTLYAQWYAKTTLASVLGSDLTFTTPSDGTGWFGQAADKINGTGAARSGNIDDDEEATFSTKVTGRGKISFDYMVSSEASYDGLVFAVDGTEVLYPDDPQDCSGEVSDSFSYDITSPGEHTLKWIYRKDYSNSEGKDCAYVNNVKWTPTAYTVTFYGNNGTPATQTKEYKDGVALGSFPTQPTRSGYIFSGWFTAMDGGTKITTSTLGDSTVTKLYAQWADAGKHTVVFSGNGASGGMKTQEFVVDVAGTLQSNPFSRDGYDFVKWTTEEDGTGTSYSNGQSVTFSSAGVTTLYAQWQGKSYTVTFDANGGSVTPTSKSYTTGATMGELPTPTWAGHTFKGWKIGGTEITATTTFNWTADQTATAQWNDLSYTLNFDANGGTVTPANTKIVYNGTLGTLPTPVWEGHDFIGWQIDGSPVSSGTIFTWTETKTAVAKWEATIYTINFDANGGTVSMADMFVAYGDAVGGMPTPVWPGHTFTGWEVGGSPLTSSTVYLWTANQTAVAQWSTMTYTLTFNANGGSVGTTSITVGFEAPLGTLPTPTRTNYTFTGWQIGGATVNDSTPYTWTANQTAVAQWVENAAPGTYNIHFDGSGATGAAPADKTGLLEDADVTLPNAGSLAKSGCTFKGWSTIPGATTAQFTAGQSATMATLGASLGSTITLYAVWETSTPPPPPPPPGTYTIHFVGGSGTTGTAPADKTGLTSSASVTLPGAGSLAKSGCTFKGWAKTAGSQAIAFTAGQSVTMSTLGATLGSTLTLYAVWQATAPVPPPGPTPEQISDPEDPHYDPTSPLFIPPELYRVKATTAFAGNVQYAGWVRDAHGAVKGSVLIKAAKAKKDFTSKLTVTYTPFGGKKQTIKNFSPVNPAVGGKPTVTIPEIGTVTIGDDSFASSDNKAQVGQDFTKSKDKTVKAAAMSRMINKIGSYTFALGMNGNYAGFTVTVDKKGKGKLAGTLPDGTKVSVSSQGILGDRALAIPFVFSKKGSFGLVFWVYDNGALGISDLTEFKNAAGQRQTLTWHGVSRTHELAPGNTHMVKTEAGTGLLQMFSVAGGKWTFPKKDANPWGYKISFKAKDGSAKGSVNYVDAATGKKVKLTVVGAVVGNTFYGTAYNKKVGAFPVVAE